MKREKEKYVIKEKRHLKSINEWETSEKVVVRSTIDRGVFLRGALFEGFSAQP